MLYDCDIDGEKVTCEAPDECEAMRIARDRLGVVHANKQAAVPAVLPETILDALDAVDEDPLDAFSGEPIDPMFNPPSEPEPVDPVPAPEPVIPPIHQVDQVDHSKNHSKKHGKK